MNLTSRTNLKLVSKYLLSTLLLTLIPGAFGPLTTANAAPASTITSNTSEAKCASTASDTSSAKLDVLLDGNYCVLRFLSSTNTWTAPSQVKSIDYLVVGGGGGGGGGRGGGGGAGGFVSGTISSNSLNSVSISVAAGGAGAVNNMNGSNGETSTISYTSTTISAAGGGGGGTSFSNAANYPARSGASGGGAGVYSSGGTSNDEVGTPGGLGIPGQGNNGGSSGGKASNNGTDSSYSYKGSCTQNWDRIRNTAGGGGAGGAGIAGRGGAAPLMDPVNLDSCQIQVAPDGGAGLASRITGTARFYAAGGGGAAGRFDKDTENRNYYTAPAGSGGSSIGGAGSAIAGTNGGAGLANTGSGGGGGGVSRTTDSDKGACASGSDLDESCDGGAGGSGVVIIRFQLPSFTNDASECITGITNTAATVLDYSTVSGDCVLTFSTPDSVTSGTNSWTVPFGVETVSAVIVGGGGGGGSRIGGGGGGGQVVDSSTVPLILKPGTTYNLTIGKGGVTRADSDKTGGTNGEISSITATDFMVKALGGGGAAGAYDNTAPYPYADTTGWTTGGEGLQLNWSSGYSITSANANNFPVGGANFKGGMGGKKQGAFMGGGGGGGGAGGPGGDTYYIDSTNHGGGNGGAGVSTTILGFTKCFGGGGGGGASTTDGGTSLSTATCGGAGGARASTAINNATPDTGGGGGGGGTYVATVNGGRGATGLIIVRFRLSNPTGASQNLNMACHGFSDTSKTVSGSISNGYYASRFATDSTTAEFSFPAASETSTVAKQNWGSGAPTGCGSNGANFTIYMWGYIRSLSLTDAATQNFFLETDMAVRVKLDGVDAKNDANGDYELVTSNSCDSTGQGSGGTYNCGSSTGANKSFTTPTLAANSWHFVEIWLHERDPANRSLYPNALNASFMLAYQPGGVITGYPRSLISKSIPRTITPSLVTNSQTSVPTLTASVDTATVVKGGVNDSTTVMSMGGKFSFFESGTAISTCQNIQSVNGSASCVLDTVTVTVPKRYFKFTFTPDSSTASTDLQYNVFATSMWDGVILTGKTKNATLRIGQYIAFTGLSTYPLNVYGDGTIYGAITRSLTDSGTANCEFDASKFFISASRVGSCTVSASAAGDASHYAETTTATLYWIQWSDAYATRVPSGPTEIVLSHKTQITKYNFETLTVTSYQNGSGGSVTQIAPNAQLRIIGDGFDPTDSTTEVVFGNAEIVDMNYSIPALQIVSDGSGGYYLLVTVPSAATTDVVLVNSRKGTAAGPTLNITP